MRNDCQHGCHHDCHRKSDSKPVFPILQPNLMAKLHFNWLHNTNLLPWLVRSDQSFGPGVDCWLPCWPPCWPPWCWLPCPGVYRPGALNLGSRTRASGRPVGRAAGQFTTVGCRYNLYPSSSGTTRRLRAEASLRLAIARLEHSQLAIKKTKEATSYLE